MILQKTLLKVFSYLNSIVNPEYIATEKYRSHGYCAWLQIKQSRLEPWLETLCYVLGQDTWLEDHGASLHPGVEMDTSEFNAGVNPAID